MFKGLLRATLASAIGLALVMSVGGCESDAATGAGLGALGGAGIGALIGNASGGHAAGGALIGAGAGALGGYLIGNEMDKSKTKAEMNAVQQEANTVVVNVTNSNGSITPVILRRSGNMYIGPKGEQYMTLPTAETLKPLYGI
jgi:uncharacterized protein YcfJ